MTNLINLIWCQNTTFVARLSYKIDGNDKFLVPDALFAIETNDGKTCFWQRAGHENKLIYKNG